MRILAFDTALDACTVAAGAGGEVLAARSQRRERGHAEALMPMIEAVRREAGLDYGDLDLVATTVGPGSFTGIRVGVAAARGIALAAGVRAVGVTTTAALALLAAAQAQACEPILAVLDARRGEASAQLFDCAGGCPRARWPQPVRDSLAGIAAAVEGEAGLVVGDAAAAFRALLLAPQGWRDAGIAAPSGGALLRLARATVEHDRAAPPPSPLYMRPPAARPPPGR